VEETSSRQSQKRRAAESAVALVESGMVVGLGAGSTATLAVERLAALVAEGQLRDLVCIPCSDEVERHARGLGLPVCALSERPHIDITIDGADEVDPRLDLIKGAGGALLHEKMVAQASRREVIIVDEGKLSPCLGTHSALPVEVFPFGWRAEEVFLQGLGATPVLRMNGGTPLVTGEGNYILDCRLGPIADPRALAAALDGRAGVAGHGLFLGLATDVFVGGDTAVRHLTPVGRADADESTG
jgi:ribose 5-phosphate isomerase A